MSILFSNMRDERNILEWVIYHLLLGFDKIYIFDHLSKVPIADTLKAYNLPQVHVQRIEDEKTNKAGFMKMALEKAQNYEWLLYKACLVFLFIFYSLYMDLW